MAGGVGRLRLHLSHVDRSSLEPSQVPTKQKNINTMVDRFINCYWQGCAESGCKCYVNNSPPVMLNPQKQPAEIHCVSLLNRATELFKEQDMACTYEIPKWAAKPPAGLHLDVMKGEKLVQKLMIDERKSYLFGRNPRGVDFCIDHASCSRFHAVLVYHRHLERAFLIDLGSTHGTYIGNMRIESNKPTQLPIDSRFRFGASTRQYVIRERPPIVVPRPIMEELERSTSDSEGALLGLPETDSELDNLTEFNTAHNRRISMLGISDDDKRLKNRQRKKKSVTFNDEEEVINPEDIDPSIGRFRNLVQTTVIPSTKRPKLDSGLVPNPALKNFVPRVANLYDDLPPDANNSSVTTPFFTSLSSKLGLPLPNPAPDIEVAVEEPPPSVSISIVGQAPIMEMPDEPRKKKYAKEAWPGKKTGPSNLLV